MTFEIIKTDEEISNSKPLYIFGRDVTQIPCFRRSFIFGICSGVVGGLATFLVTSKTLFSTHTAFASIWIGVFAYWIPCRYSYESKKLALEYAQEQKRLQNENTEDNKKEEKKEEIQSEKKV